MDQGTYYTIVAGSAAAGLLGSFFRWVVFPVYRFFNNMSTAIQSLQSQIDLMLNNHLHDLKERVGSIERYILSGKDTLSIPRGGRIDREGIRLDPDDSGPRDGSDQGSVENNERS